MTDNWDDSDDEWDVGNDDELDARLGLKNLSTAAPQIDDDEEDLTLKEKELASKQEHAELKKKGTALAEKKKAEQERLEEEELARKAVELEAEMEANLSPDELRQLKRQQIEEADNALTDDLFGGVDDGAKGKAVAAAGETLVLKDLKDHLKHARKVANAIKVSSCECFEVSLFSNTRLFTKFTRSRSPTGTWKGTSLRSIYQGADPRMQRCVGR
jgi:translation initiation factor 3 subunit J